MKKSIMAALVMLMAAVWGISAEAQQTGAQLNPVVVTATKTEKDPKDVTQSVTVITAEDIRRSTATTVAEVVRDAAGLSLIRQGVRGSLDSLSIRGANYSQVLVLLDGVRLNSPRDSGVDLSALPIALEDIERIEIVRGSSSALYGADAVGGVVNIITKKPDAPVSRIGGAIGSHGYDTIQAGASGRHKGGTYSLSGVRETSDGYRENSDLEQWTVNGKLGYDFAQDTSLDLTANYVSKENGTPGSLTYPSATGRQWDRTLVLGTSFRQRFSAAFDLKVSAGMVENRLMFKDPDIFVDSLHKSTTETAEGLMTLLAGDWSLFTLGYETKKDSLDSTNSGDHETTNAAWYLQDEINMGKSLIIVVGQRYDKHSVYGEQWSSRASGRYLLGSGTVVRFSYGEGFRAPTFNDLYWSDPWAIGNPDLRPETSVEYEAGIEQSMSAGSGIKLAGFRRKVKDLINWNWMIFPMQPENIGRADIRGAEAEASIGASDSISLRANYTYLRALDDVTGDKLYSTLYPRNQIKGSITFAVDKDVSITAEGRSVENYVRPGDPKWRYSVYDAKISQKIGQKGSARGEIYFAMTNIFDREYENARGYPMPPKEIRGGMTIPF